MMVSVCIICIAVFILTAHSKENITGEYSSEDILYESDISEDDVYEENVSEDVTEDEIDTGSVEVYNEYIENEYIDEIEEILGEMTLREKICQMLLVNPESITGVLAVTSAGETTRDALEEYPVGGIMFSKKNLVSTDQTTEMISNIQSYSNIDLFIAIDEEGGVVNRIMTALDTTYINSMYTYKDDGYDTAYNNALTIASDMAELGFNLDFAPVADVWSNPDNTVIGVRAYSDDFNEAAELISYAVKGFHDGNVMCTLKHFPGHGNTVEDSHYGTAYVYKTKEELSHEELLPFISGIEAGADFIMVGHLMIPDIDDVPATLSEEIITGMLREELGYDGIIITDSLEMSAIADCYTTKETAVLAIKAGNDMLLEPSDIDGTIAAIEEAVENGEITEERIDESVRRILSVKLNYGLSLKNEE